MFKFLTYNNSVPIAISLVLLGAGGAFAATDPEAIYSTQQTVVSIDNTFLVNRDLSSYSPRVEITEVTEDTEMYYVVYNFYTIDLQDSVWRDVTKTDTLKVSKADLGQYRDLGVYVTEQLKQRTDRELAYLQEVQGIERKNVTHKVVATQYGGLVGKFLDTSTEALPGYTPVVTPPPPVQVAAVGTPQSGQPPVSDASPVVVSGNPTMTMQILGNSPAQIPQRSSYLDLGVVASDGHNSVMRIETYLDGVKVDQVNINTTATSTHTIRYVALDPQDNSLTGERTVIVYNPAVGQPVPQDQVKSGVTIGASVTPVVPPTTTTETTSTTPTQNTTVPSTTTTTTTAATTTTTTTATSTPTTPTTTSTATSTTQSTATTTPATTASSTPVSTATTTPTTVTPTTTTSATSSSQTSSAATTTSTSTTTTSASSESTTTATTTSATTDTSSDTTTPPTESASSTAQSQ